MPTFKGIDVSKHQGIIDWKKVKQAGVQFAMIRASLGSNIVDDMLDANVKGCEENGIDYGFYHYTYATDTNQAIQEADFFLSTIKNYKPTYPVALDIEDKSLNGIGKQGLTQIAYTFLERVENQKYYTVIYCNKNWIQNMLIEQQLARFDKWIADWRGIKPDYTSYGMWQYSVLGTKEQFDKKAVQKIGSVSGINTAIDVDYSYKNYPDIIKSRKLNNTAVPEPKPVRYKLSCEKSNLSEDEKNILAYKLSQLDMEITLTEIKDV